MIALAEPKPVPKIPRKVPSYLIYEIMDGKPLYYKDYRSVLKGTKTFEEIMGASSLQSLIIYYLNKVLYSFIEDEQFYIFSSESGVHINHRSNLANDIALYDPKLLTPDKISKKYADVPPTIVFEIDIDAELEDMTETGYIYNKTRKLLDFGTEKVLWVLTAAQVVIVATKERIETFDWNRDIEIMDGFSFNIGEYLKKKGVELE
ncbi:MAG: Uma2 family endonuclease [Spirosomaceae bacterium]|jgi:hypothetical protein|nr:Uma2 family endonuclease [Spirosomataceae bacterium]